MVSEGSGADSDYKVYRIHKAFTSFLQHVHIVLLKTHPAYSVFHDVTLWVFSCLSHLLIVVAGNSGIMHGLAGRRREHSFI